MGTVWTTGLPRWGKLEFKSTQKMFFGRNDTLPTVAGLSRAGQTSCGQSIHVNSSFSNCNKRNDVLHALFPERDRNSIDFSVTRKIQRWMLNKDIINCNTKCTKNPISDWLWHFSHQRLSTGQLQLHGSLSNSQQVGVSKRWDVGRKQGDTSVTPCSTSLSYISLFLKCWNIDDSLVGQLTSDNGICRINHSCLPNSHHWWDAKEEEKVLFCSEDLEVGWTNTKTF